MHTLHIFVHFNKFANFAYFTTSLPFSLHLSKLDFDSIACLDLLIASCNVFALACTVFPFFLLSSYVCTLLSFGDELKKVASMEHCNAFYTSLPSLPWQTFPSLAQPFYIRFPDWLESQSREQTLGISLWRHVIFNQKNWCVFVWKSQHVASPLKLDALTQNALGVWEEAIKGRRQFTRFPDPPFFQVSREPV